MRYRQYRDNNKRLIVAVEGMPSLAYRYITREICRLFQLSSAGEYVWCEQGSYHKFTHGRCNLSMDWGHDNGFTVTALSPDSEPLVKDIGQWLQQKYRKHSQ